MGSTQDLDELAEAEEWCTRWLHSLGERGDGPRLHTTPGGHHDMSKTSITVTIEFDHEGGPEVDPWDLASDLVTTEVVHDEGGPVSAYRITQVVAEHDA